MAFRLEQTESVEAGVRRIVTEQIDKALAELADPRATPNHTVHQIRTRCKKIRAVLRLVRDALGKTYRPENTRFRDLAAGFASLRDADVIIGTGDKLMEHFGRRAARERYAGIRNTLVARQRIVASRSAPLQQLFKDARVRLEQARNQVAAWQLDPDGFEAIEKGLSRTYRRGRKAMTRLQSFSPAGGGDPVALPAVLRPRHPASRNLLVVTRRDIELMKAFHEWRKRVKYLRYQVRILRNLWRPVMRELHNELVELSNLLGEAHDLAVLRQTLLKPTVTIASRRQLHEIIATLDRRRAGLLRDSWPLGRRLYSEKPRALTRRFQGYWNAWAP